MVGEVQVIATGEKQDFAIIDSHSRRLCAAEHPHASVSAAVTKLIEQSARVGVDTH
jgi:hypothetical protein